MGLGHQSLGINIVDLLLATLVNLLMWSSAYRKFWLPPGEDEKEFRHDAAIPARIKWFVGYASLATILIVIMHFQQNMMPAVIGHH